MQSPRRTHPREDNNEGWTMAKIATYFPGAKYPGSYKPPLEAFPDYNPTLGELLVGLPRVSGLKADGDSWTGKMENGLLVSLTGKGFTYDDDVVTGGTITGITVLQQNGKTKVIAATDLKLSFEDFMDRADEGDAWRLVRWVLNSDDTYTGSSGDDDLFGSAGNDTLKGGKGYDFLTGGAGRDTYDGGADDDTINFSDTNGDPSALHGIELDAAKGTVIDPWGNKEKFVSIEGFRGSQFKDEMLGSARDENFAGMGGADTIDGKGGIDTVRYDKDANRGGDRGVIVDLAKGSAVDGFGRMDVLRNIENVRGSSFDDTITGSAVSNRVELREGDDTFVFSTKLNEKTNVDSIADFNSSDDTLKLDDKIFTALDTGELDSDAFKDIGKSGAKVDKDDRVIYDRKSGEVFYDQDGSAKNYDAIKFAELENKAALSASDFLVV
jgi:serralysin